MKRLLLLILLIATPASAQTARPERIVSLVPAVTEMIYAMGDGARVAAVSNYDHFPAEVASLPRVGGLLDPSVERILAIKPDLVIVYATQKELIERLDRAGIPYFNYQHKALPDIMTTIRALGARIGSAAAPTRWPPAWIDRSPRFAPGPPACRTPPRCSCSSAIRRRCATSTRAADTAFSTTCSRSPAAATSSPTVKQQAVQASTEMLIASKPEVIIELLYGDSLKNADIAKELRAWDALASVPAVRSHRISALTGDEFVVPGPARRRRHAQAGAALHPDLFK